MATNTREQATGTAPATEIADGETGAINWQHISGDKLLTYADPANPKIVTAGTYAVAANVRGFDGPQSGAIGIQIVMGDSGASIPNFSPADVSDAWGSPLCGASMTWRLAAGEAIIVQVINATGSATPLNFGGAELAVQRVA